MPPSKRDKPGTSGIIFFDFRAELQHNGEISLHRAFQLSPYFIPLRWHDFVKRSVKFYQTMKDMIVLIGVFLGGYIVSMTVLYVTFRIFFPITVEKADSEWNSDSHSENQRMKAMRQSRSTSANAQHHKTELVHG